MFDEPEVAYCKHCGLRIVRDDASGWAWIHDQVWGQEKRRLWNCPIEPYNTLEATP